MRMSAFKIGSQSRLIDETLWEVQKASEERIIATIMNEKSTNHKIVDLMREEQKAGEERIIATIKKEKSTKDASRMSDSDFRSLCIAGHDLNDEFWSRIETGASSELVNGLTKIVESFTANALALLLSKTTAEVRDVQPLGRATIAKLIKLVNEQLETAFAMDCELKFETFMHMHGQPYSVKGQYDAVILDTITHIHVMSWEFKKLDAKLTKSNIAQLAATMWHGINVSREMTKCPKRAVGFLTSGREWIMVTATFTDGEYKWAATPPLATICHAEVDVGVCGHVVKLLCYAFFNARMLHTDASAATMQALGPLDFNHSDGESSTNPPGDDPNEDDDGNDGADTAPRSHGGVGGTEKVGHFLRSAARRRPLGNANSNCTAPLTMRNLEKCESTTWLQMPLARFKSSSTF
jgi:hypothetical protein